MPEMPSEVSWPQVAFLAVSGLVAWLAQRAQSKTARSDQPVGSDATVRDAEQKFDTVVEMFVKQVAGLTEEVRVVRAELTESNRRYQSLLGSARAVRREHPAITWPHLDPVVRADLDQ